MSCMLETYTNSILLRSVFIPAYTHSCFFEKFKEKKELRASGQGWILGKIQEKETKGSQYSNTYVSLAAPT